MRKSIDDIKEVQEGEVVFGYRSALEDCPRLYSFTTVAEAEEFWQKKKREIELVACPEKLGDLILTVAKKHKHPLNAHEVVEAVLRSSNIEENAIPVRHAIGKMIRSLIDQGKLLLTLDWKVKVNEKK